MGHGPNNNNIGNKDDDPTIDHASNSAAESISAASTTSPSISTTHQSTSPSFRYVSIYIYFISIFQLSLIYTTKTYK